MRVRLFAMWPVITLLIAVPVWAVDIQYELSTTWVAAVSDVPLESVPGYGLITLTGATASQIIWPLPSGCPTGTGTSQWTRVTNPATVAVDGTGLALRPGLIFFHSTSPLAPGCYPVGSKKQVKAVRDEAIITATRELDLVNSLAGVNTWKAELCPPTNNNASCVSWRASADIVNSSYPSRVQGSTLSSEMATLVQDVNAFISAQCAATPGGPFC